MKLNRRTVYSTTLAIFLAAGVFLFGAVILLTRYVILSQVSDFEVHDAVGVTKRLEFDLAQTTAPAEIATRDWAQWNDLHDFASGSAPAFVDEHLGEGVLDGLKLDFFILVSLDGVIRHVVVRDQTPPPKKTRLHQLTAEDLTEAGLILSGASTGQSGFFLVDQELAAVASAPIRRSDGSGPFAGTLIGGRFLGSQVWVELLSRAGGTGRFYPNDGHLNETLGNERLTRILGGDPFFVEPRSERELTSYILLRSIDRSILGVIALTLEREVYREGLQAVQFFIVGISLAGVVLVVVVWILLDRTILARIRTLKRKLDEAKEQGRLPVQLHFRGSDELGDLAASIEGLAVRLEDLQDQYRAVVEDQTELICRFTNDLGLTFANGAFLRFFRLDETPLRLIFLRELVWPPDWDEFRRTLEQLNPQTPVASLLHRVSLPDGGFVWLRSTLRRSFDGKHGDSTSQWVATDVTKEIEARRQLEDSEVRFRMLFQAAADGFVLVDETSLAVVDANGSFYAMTRSTAATTVGRPVRAVLPFLPWDEVELTAGSEGNETASTHKKGINCAIILADNSTLRLEVTASPFQANERRLVLLNFRDVSERVRNERELRSLSLRLMNLQDDERRRIARELHDSTAQNLSALEMNISLLEPLIDRTNTRAVRIVADSCRIARDCSNELRNISYLLHPPLLDEVGLTFAIKWFADGFSRRSGIRVDLELDESIGRMPPEVEITFFRVVQEALSNIYRHAEAKWACISLAGEAGQFVQLDIKDDGKGLSTSANSRVEPPGGLLGVGLAGMRERLSQLGGTFELFGSGQGVHLRASVNLATIHGHSPD